MKPFRFSLTAILDHRRRVEEVRARELAGAQQEALKARSDQREWNEALDSERRSFSERLGAGTAGILRTHLTVLEHFRRKLEEASAVADAAERAVEIRSRALQVASQDRQVLSRLKERRRTEWKVEFRRLEQLETDETARTRHLRSVSGESGE